MEAGSVEALDRPIEVSARRVGLGGSIEGALPLVQARTIDLALGGLVAATSLAAYLAHLLGGVGFWDTGVYQAAAPTLGLTHPTGFPTYLMLGWLVTTVVPIGDAALRMNLLSAFAAAIAAGVLYLLIRGLGGGRLIAVSAALSFALLEPVWRTAVRADPHTLNILLFLSLCLLVLEWRRRGRPMRLLVAAAFLGGLAVGNHTVMLAAGPALAGFVVITIPGVVPRLRAIAAASLGFGAGLLVYIYVPLRAAADPPVRPDYLPATWDTFWRYVLGTDFVGIMGFLTPSGPRTAIEGWPTFLRALDGRVGGLLDLVVLALAAVGLLGLARRDRAVAFLFGVAGSTTLYLALTFGDGDIQRYYFVPFAVIALCAALGLQDLSRWRPPTVIGHALAARLGPSRDRLEQVPFRMGRFRPALAAPALLAVPLALFVLNGSRVENFSAACYAETLIGEVKPDAVIVSTWSYTTPLWYERFVLGKRPDVQIVNGGADLVAGQLDALFGDRRPIYLVQDAATFEQVRHRYETRPIVACGVSVVEVSAVKAGTSETMGPIR